MGVWQTSDLQIKIYNNNLHMFIYIQFMVLMTMYMSGL